MRWIVFLGIAGIGVLCVLLFLALISPPKPDPAGPHTMALYYRMLAYKGRTFDEFGDAFGEPDSGYFPHLQGVVHTGWIYKESDGQVRVIGPTRENRIEYIFAEY